MALIARLTALRKASLNALLLSTVVLGELEFGAEKSAWAARNRQRLNELTERLPLAAQATLVTDNEGEFRRVPGLALENWLRDEA
ncbi:type II toxin-antitoxin system VapC family toxin [Comamonas flocculans]|uniref:Type II toxin-antitoxin system VapC family toxin n=1 Tax=Comamonas flocculans TaxID=2597701 RepID=A0A5B8RYC6_9BURK|nr:type II toxin-antitoxin system VapC family toxin [Comamonas flocculans]QEA13602.1 type II toxin-antitoxin system VapC family toxin [Comamonas flocculans]